MKALLAVGFMFVSVVFVAWLAGPPSGHLMCWYVTVNADAQHPWGSHRDCTRADYANRQMPVPNDVSE